jgi:glycosyltransferase involved in cell wall biosynthesis
MIAKITVATHHPIWFKNTGTRNRIAEFYSAIKKDSRFEVTLAYLRYFNEADRAKLSADREYNAVSIPALAKKGAKYEPYPSSFLQENPVLRKSHNIPCWYGLQEYLLSKPDVVLFTYIEQLYLLPAIKGRVVTAIDTNDLNSMRASIFNLNKKPIPLNISLRDEMRILSMLDFSVAIQEDEFSIISANISPSKASYVPHMLSNVDVKKRGGETGRISVLYPASHQRPNIDGLVWFLTNVWPSLPSHLFTLDVCGSICDSIEINELKKSGPPRNVRFLGIVDDLAAAYNQADVVINPCPYGSGLKIKSVEALSYGVPLVTTSVGAEGLRTGAGKAFLVADTAAEFILALYCLTSQKNRMALSKKSADFMSDFSCGGAHLQNFLQQVYSKYQYLASEAE